MKDIIFEELRTIYQEMTPEQEKAAVQPAAHCIGLLDNFCDIKRKAGILWMQGFVEYWSDYLSKLIMMMVNGREWEEIENVGISEYFSKHAKKSTVDRLVTLMDLAGVELLFQEMNTYIIEEHLLAMAPAGTEELIDEEQKKAGKELYLRMEEAKKKMDPFGDNFEIPNDWVMSSLKGTD